jgi:hypothetical protein
MPHSHFDAMLRNWVVLYRSDDPTGAPVLLGQIMGDRKGRYPDGRWIMTSDIRTPVDDMAAGTIVVTRNSRYLLMAHHH